MRLSVPRPSRQPSWTRTRKGGEGTSARVARARERVKPLWVFFSIFFLPLAMCYAGEAHVRVDLGGAGKKVSPNQFGIFLEEINHAGDGGLYNELVRNGSFTEATTLDAWSVLRGSGAEVNLFFDDSVPLSPTKPRSLRIEVGSFKEDRAGGGHAGVSNGGYWG